eukprot:TRINITY_DN16322_c0_g1_i2.p1 TRINITY_DN16322_c0_g1~~TRINITY_DN16322_c0_g1_i2.p1  ORF type:complete len:421 (+),score=26.32 TRINITY_DN16322_c0_g1_i2:182-1444(+)
MDPATGDPTTLRTKTAVWYQLHDHFAREGILIRDYPSICYAPVDLATLWVLVQEKGGYQALCADQQCTFSDKDGHQAPWSKGWESLVKPMRLRGLDPEAGLPWRRLKLKTYYEQYLLKFEPSRDHEGEIAMVPQPEWEHIRCVCGHSHRWPLEPELKAHGCTTCTGAGFLTQAQCLVCNCWQHVGCAVTAGIVGPEQAAQLGSLDYVCEMCVPLESPFRAQLGLGSARNSQSRTIEECHKKLAMFELPERFSWQHLWRLTDPTKSDYYIHEGDDVFMGSHTSSVIRSMTHLQEKLGLVVPKHRSYGKSKSTKGGGGKRQKRAHQKSNHPTAPTGLGIDLDLLEWLRSPPSSANLQPRTFPTMEANHTTDGDSNMASVGTRLLEETHPTPVPAAQDVEGGAEESLAGGQPTHLIIPLAPDS